VARAETVEKGHGRIETRRIAVSREVVPYLAWPGLAQVARLERTREVAGSYEPKDGKIAAVSTFVSRGSGVFGAAPV